MFGLGRSNKVDIEEKVFLYICDNQGVTTEKIVKRMEQFFDEDEKKKRKKVLDALEELEKKRILFHQGSFNWQLSADDHWFPSTTDECARYYTGIQQAHGVIEDES